MAQAPAPSLPRPSGMRHFGPKTASSHDISDLVTQAGIDFGASRSPALNPRLAGTHRAGGPRTRCAR